jgi:hypothetical protein
LGSDGGTSHLAPICIFKHWKMDKVQNLNDANWDFTVQECITDPWDKLCQKHLKNNPLFKLLDCGPFNCQFSYQTGNLELVNVCMFGVWSWVVDADMI